MQPKQNAVRSRHYECAPDADRPARSATTNGFGYFVFNQIAVSQSLQENQWKPNVSLERGKIYKWQVTAANSPESYAAQFKVLDENAVARLKAVESAAPNSPLVRGIGYASEGLLTEAAREFEKEIRRNPRGKLAKRLKNSLVKNSKRRQ